MSQLLCAAANSLWYLSCLPGSLLFRRALRDVAGTQRQVLARLLRRNAATEFGRRHAFVAIHSIAEYQACVPLSTYDDYRESIERIGLGQPDVLTHDPVLVLELTGGSTGATRQIPYTAALKAEYGRAIAPWIANLYTHNPRLLLGQAYWSVTPVARRNERTAGGIPVGFEEDSEYFGALQRHLIQAVMAVPPLVRLIDDMEAFRYVTLLFLLRSCSLALISVWNPTFLTLLIGRLAAWWPCLVDDIASGTISAPAAVEPTLHTRLVALNRPDPRRAEEIRSLCRSMHDMGALHTRLWPNLRLISCWTDAHAGMHVAELARLFPEARVQGKGLLATEGVVSFPLVGHSGPALAIRSHFFEFLPVGGGPVALAHELELHREYSVVITTGGGLYRYQLHDLVEVVGHLGRCPLLRFVGKAAHISDRFGEKLDERHVREALDQLCIRHALEPAFAMVAYEDEAGRHAYTLFVEAPGHGDAALAALGAGLEQALQENYHYRYCRDLGQLDALRVFRIAEGGLETYLSVCQLHGQRAGDIKPVALHRLDGWTSAFQGHFLEHRV